VKHEGLGLCPIESVLVCDWFLQSAGIVTTSTQSLAPSKSICMPGPLSLFQSFLLLEGRHVYTKSNAALRVIQPLSR
jgi:hypothetical protein